MEAPTLYCPTQCQYPMDIVCQKIVSELEKQRWECPGIVTILRDHKVHTITGRHFKITFSLNSNVITEIIIPKKELRVFTDQSGPELFIYVGKNWEKDREQFVNGQKVMAKTKGKPRTYLAYVGKDSIIPNVQVVKKRKLAEYLVVTNNFDRDYSAEKDDPIYYKTDEIFQEFVSYLEENVLKEIEKSKDFFSCLDNEVINKEEFSFIIKM